MSDVLDADERGFGTTEVPPAAGFHDDVRPFDAPEEVVRGEEHQVSAEVAVPLDEIVFTRGHVLVVPGEDDQVVRPASAAGLSTCSRSHCER